VRRLPKRKRKSRSKKLVVTVPKGMKKRTVVKEKKRDRRNPVVLRFGTKKRKFHIGIGREPPGYE
jgi:hypothetical protein